MRVVEARGRWMKWLPAAGLAVLAAVAWAGATMNATSGTIGTNVAFAAFGFDPGTKSPKAELVPAGGGKPVKMRVFAFDPTRIDAQVVKGVVGDYGIVLTSADRSVAPVTVDGTFTIVPPAPASVEPASGPVKVPAVILGTSFGDAKGKVTIGGKNAKVTRWASDRIEVVVPKKLAAGAQPVVVIGKAGVSVAPLSFTVDAAASGGSSRLFKYDIGTFHFETTKQEAYYFTSTFNVSQDVLGVGASGKPSGLPSMGISINHPALATPMPYDVTTGADPTGTLLVSHGANGSVYVSAYGSNFKLTITAYSGGVLEGTFGGELTRIFGTGPTPLTVTNGQFKVLVSLVGQ